MAGPSRLAITGVAVAALAMLYAAQSWAAGGCARGPGGGGGLVGPLPGGAGQAPRGGGGCPGGGFELRIRIAFPGPCFGGGGGQRMVGPPPGGGGGMPPQLIQQLVMQRQQLIWQQQRQQLVVQHNLQQIFQQRLLQQLRQQQMQQMQQVVVQQLQQQRVMQQVLLQQRRQQILQQRMLERMIAANRPGQILRGPPNLELVEQPGPSMVEYVPLDEEQVSTARLKLALILRDGGSEEDAREYLKDILANYPETSAADQARLYLGGSANPETNIAPSERRAESSMSQSNSLSPRLPLAPTEKLAVAKLKLAQTLRSQGKLDDARDFYKYIISTYAGTDSAEEARRLLQELDSKPTRAASVQRAGIGQ